MNGIIQTIKLGMVNVFLIPCEDGYLLVDSGYTQTHTQLIEAFQKLGIKTTDIRYLFLTHHHNDHCGSAAVLQQTSNCTLITHKNTLPFLESGSGDLGEVKPATPGIRLMLSLFKLVSSADYHYTPLTIRPDDLIVDGDNFEFLPSIGIPGKILYTPGHTDNSLSIVLNNGFVLCGDLCFNSLLFKLFGSGNKPIYIQDEEAVYRSWQRVYQHGGRTIIPSHGSPFPIKNLLNLQA